MLNLTSLETLYMGSCVVNKWACLGTQFCVRELRQLYALTHPLVDVMK